ncbi:hypothetical protein [Microlunatus soli]|uniref:Uncharacterized protein n=1 Tax=Microlunatus soli TaxID=630515 RepID=A0A1H1VK99_9ACTN|nr:hypothetical protein [Microlunatus soli]SDS85125.1 hypothetical protein SAMN04489812_3247 [Microlunatus soli]
MRRLLIIASLCLSLLGCSIGNADDELVSAGEVESIAKVVLPPGTVLLSAVEDGFQDWHLTAAARMAKSDLPAFLTDSGLGEPTAGLRSVHTKDRRHDSDSWDPDAVTSFSGIRSQLRDDAYRSVLIDTSSDTVVVVYLTAFTT